MESGSIDVEAKIDERDETESRRGAQTSASFSRNSRYGGAGRYGDAMSSTVPSSGRQSTSYTYECANRVGAGVVVTSSRQSQRRLDAY